MKGGLQNFEIRKRKKTAGTMTGETNIRVCFITGRYPPEYSGAGKSVEDLANYRWKSEKGVLILTFPDSFSEVFEKANKNPFPVVRIKRSSEKGNIGLLGLCQAGYHLFKMRKLYDVIHSFGAGWLDFLIPIFGFFFGKPTMFTMTLFDSSDLQGIRSQKLGRTKSWLFRKYDMVTGKSQVMVDRSVQTGMQPEKIIYVPNAVPFHSGSGIKMQERKKVREMIGVPERAYLCSFLGNLSKRKGVDILIEAWKKLAEEGIYLLLIGPKNRNESPRIDLSFVRKLEFEMDRFSLKKWIRMVGYVQDPLEVFSFLKASDLFVFPSRREGFPQALLLAMAAGLPSVCSPFPGHEDLLKFGTDPVCQFLEHGDRPGEVVDAVRGMSKDSVLSKSLGLAGQQLVSRHYSQQVVFQKYENVYRRLMDGRKRACER